MKDRNGVKIAVGDTLYSHTPSLIAQVVGIEDSSLFGAIPQAQSFCTGGTFPVYVGELWEVVPEDKPLVCNLPASWDEDVKRREFLQECDDFWLR